MLIEFKSQTELPIIQALLLLFERPEDFLNAISGMYGLAKDTHDLDDRSTNFEVGFNDCNETVCDSRNLYLYSDCVLGFSPKAFDLKLLLNPHPDTFTKAEGRIMLMI